ncbi:hypothetical protein KY335_04010 [Candidatus Woesearchaeota archaeon]|nr:hypothetical protein [Candidatus Woesearchaeota archaeon]
MSISWYCVIGRTKGKLFEKDGPGFQINLGILSFGFYWINIEEVIHGLLQKDNKKDLDELRARHAEQLKRIEREAHEKYENLKIEGKGEIKKLEDKISEIKEKMQDKIDELDDDLTDASATNDELEEEIQKLKELVEERRKETEILVTYFMRNDPL